MKGGVCEQAKGSWRGFIKPSYNGSPPPGGASLQPRKVEALGGDLRQSVHCIGVEGGRSRKGLCTLVTSVADGARVEVVEALTASAAGRRQGRGWVV